MVARATYINIEFLVYAVESLNKGHFGDDIDSLVCPLPGGCVYIETIGRVNIWNWPQALSFGL